MHLRVQLIFSLLCFFSSSLPLLANPSVASLPMASLDEPPLLRLYTISNLLQIAHHGTDDQKQDEVLQNEAVRALQEFYPATAEGNLSEAEQRRLDSGGGAERSEIIYWLSAEGGRHAAIRAQLNPLLVIIAFRESSETARLAAVRALANLNATAQIPYLRRLISPEPLAPFIFHVSVSQEAARSLGRMARHFPTESTGFSSTLSFLTQLATEGRGNDTAAIDGIAMMGLENPTVENALKIILENSQNRYSEEARVRVIQWFRDHPRPTLIDSLRNAQNAVRSPYVRLSACHALIDLHDANKETRQSLQSLTSTLSGLPREEQSYARDLLRGLPTAERQLFAAPTIKKVCYLLRYAAP